MRAARAAAVLSIVLCLGAGCASGGGIGGPRASPGMLPDDQPVGPMSNVPVNVFVTLNPALEEGESTELVIVLTGAATSPQDLVIHSEYYPNAGSDEAGEVWDPGVPVTATYTIQPGDSFKRIRVRVKDGYAGHGVMRMEACTFLKGDSCAADGKRFAAIVINPLKQPLS